MPRNFSELKSGGTIPMLSPLPEKWGDASPPPSPTDRRPSMYLARINGHKLSVGRHGISITVVLIQHSSLWVVFAFLT